jgi:hypothetical protein
VEQEVLKRRREQEVAVGAAGRVIFPEFENCVVCGEDDPADDMFASAQGPTCLNCHTESEADEMAVSSEWIDCARTPFGSSLITLASFIMALMVRAPSPHLDVGAAFLVSALPFIFVAGSTLMVGSAGVRNITLGSNLEGTSRRNYWASGGFMLLLALLPLATMLWSAS